LLQCVIVDRLAAVRQSQGTARGRVRRCAAAAKLGFVTTLPLADEPDGRVLELFEGEARLWPAAFDASEATRLFQDLRRQIDWREEEILMFGRRVPVPRRVAWHGDPGASYTYSGAEHHPLPWTPVLERVRECVTTLAGAQFNAVLLNLYRDGRDGMGWHADDEPELGANPVIASVSLGATRRFCLRHRRRKGLRLDVPLSHGSVLVMSGATQHHWVHALPKTAAPVGERINLTFRRVGLT
jgi:alkylated DNA repair dioxygenase AlkB